ncbi:MAG TPA: hypothetical protein VIO61_00520 [Anaerolineaceae bacterium]
MPMEERGRGTIWNIFTVLLVVGTVAALAGFVLVYLNPESAYNPFPPPTSVPLLPYIPPLPTDTPSPSPLPPTWTPTPSPQPTFTPVPPTPTQTITPVMITAISFLTATPTQVSSVYPFALRSEPNAIQGSLIHPDLGCKLWVGGQAYDIKGSPYVGITVQLGGTLGGYQVSQFSLTGTAPQYYGVAGYEFLLAEKPIASKRTLWIQLLDQRGIPISSRVSFDTFDSCNANIILINFKQVR